MSSLIQLQDLIQEKYGLDAAQLDPHASMRESGIDSLALAEFLFEIEDRFHISLPEPDPAMDTLAQLAELVDKVRGGAATPSTA